MNITVFGLGYVGSVAAACLAREGHRVIGVDPNVKKIELINAGRSPIVEREVDKLIAQAVLDGDLLTTPDARSGLEGSDLSLVCVGTPSQSNGSLELRYLRGVCEDIGAELRDRSDFHTVVIRSTVLPGTMKDVVIPTLEAASGKRAGIDFGLCHNPEFLREGSAVYDYDHPAKTVIGALDERSAERLERLYSHLDAPVLRVPVDVAEMVKYTDNTWHALKVSFANEIGSICKALDIDSHAVMDVFCQDQKLNLSPSYLKPGFAFGGSCLPKDLRAINYRARSLDLELPLLSSVLNSNRAQIDRAFELVRKFDCRRVGVLGFSFKEGTDDLRESPVVELVERLLGKGYDIKLYDHNVQFAKLFGSNRDFILNQIPHISKLMVSSVEEVINHADLVVIGNRSEHVCRLMDQLPPSTRVLDLVRIAADQPVREGYEGICW